MSKKDDRLNQLIEIVKRKNSANVKELALMLNVSEMTVRRDMEELKERDVILDVPGVAVFNTQYSPNDNEEYLLSMATHAHVKEKERIGKYAASLVQQDDCIMIDNGSTVEYFADQIDPSLRITVFTCNLNILNRICNNPNISVIFGGGYFHPDTTLFECPESIELIHKIRATKVFVSAAGVHDTMGVTCMNNYELETKKALLESGAEKILLADSSKFGVIKPSFLTDINSFDQIITDENLSPEWAQTIEEQGIKLVQV